MSRDASPTIPGLRSPLAPTIVLLLITAAWGSSFPLTKELITRVPVLDYLGIRFLLAGVVLSAIAPWALRRMPRPMVIQAIILGAVYGAGQIFQTYGLEHTSAAVGGFITGLYVVLTPIFAALVLRQRLSSTIWWASGLALIGLAVLSLNGLSIGPGETIMVIGAATYAIHILCLGLWAKPEHAVAMSAVQLLVIGVICTIAAAPGGITLPASGADWALLAYLALVAGLLGMLGQTWAQGHLPAARAAIIMSTEPVFAAVFSVTVGGESFTARMAIGGALVLVAMLVAELGPRRRPEVVEADPDPDLDLNLDRDQTKCSVTVEPLGAFLPEPGVMDETYPKPR